MKAISTHLKRVFIFTILSNSCYSFETAPSKRFTLSFYEFINNFKNIYSIKLPDIKLIGIDLLYFLITYVIIVRIVLKKEGTKIDDFTKDKHQVIKILSRLLSMATSFVALDIIFALIPCCRYQVINALKLIIAVKLLEFFMSPSSTVAAPLTEADPVLIQKYREFNEWESKLQSISNKEEMLKLITKIISFFSYIGTILTPIKGKINEERNYFKITDLDLLVESSSKKEKLKTFFELIKQLIDLENQNSEIEEIFRNHFNNFINITKNYELENLEKLVQTIEEFCQTFKVYANKRSDNRDMNEKIINTGEEVVEMFKLEFKREECRRLSTRHGSLQVLDPRLGELYDDRSPEGSLTQVLEEEAPAGKKADDLAQCEDLDTLDGAASEVFDEETNKFLPAAGAKAATAAAEETKETPRVEGAEAPIALESQQTPVNEALKPPVQGAEPQVHERAAEETKETPQVEGAEAAREDLNTAMVQPGSAETLEDESAAKIEVDKAGEKIEELLPLTETPVQGAEPQVHERAAEGAEAPIALESQQTPVNEALKPPGQ